MADRILVVEDDRDLANLVAQKIGDALECEVDIAFSLLEAKLFTKKYKYFVAIIDLDLPDAPNGEIVAFMQEKDIASVIFSTHATKELKERFFQKKVIDFIKHECEEDIDYVTSIIQRIQKNRKHKVLVVDDSMIFRRQMQSILDALLFEVYAVAHGEEALGMLQAHPDIKIVITDYNMPVMDGLTLTREIRKTHSKNELSIIAISGSNDQEQTATFLRSGANDYIVKPFSKEEFTCRLNNTIEALENLEMITHNATRDFLTGVYNRRHFFTIAPNIFETAKENDEALGIAMINIDHFKNLNDTYGHQIGDKVIVSLSLALTTSVDIKDVVARFGAEEFCILFRDMSNELMIRRCESIRKKVESLLIDCGQDQFSFTISIGLALCMEDTLEETINTADMYLYNAKNSGRNQVVYG
jgi:diguanylate cyclase (GGDEF)-like protein